MGNAKGLAQEFKQFILQGNVVSLAVAVVIGAAFTAIVTAFTENIIMPLIAVIGGEPDFSSIGFTIRGAHFGIGNLINAIISFLIVAAVIFFLVIKPMNMLMDRQKEPDPESDTMVCPHCKSADVSKEATVCPHCTRDLVPQVA